MATDKTPTKKPKPKRRPATKTNADDQQRVINPEALLDKAIASGLDVGVDEIDDSDIPRAPDVLTWLVSPRYCNLRPYAKQIEDALLIFGDACPYCSNMDYVMDIPVDAKIGDIRDQTTTFKYGRCPRCQRLKLEARSEWLSDPTNHDNWGHRYKLDVPNDVAILAGQRSGKSTATAMYSTYVLHRYLKLPNPGRWFGLLRNVGALYGTFVSVTAAQAESNLWQPFSDMIDASPWFAQYHAFLASRGHDMGVELFTKLDTYLWYNHKRLGMSYAPADQRSLRGKTRFLTSVDELSWLIAGGGRGQQARGVGNIKINADGVVRALDRSLATIRMNASKKRRTSSRKQQDTPDAYMINISSPSSALDPLVRRIRRGEKSPRMYCVTRPTWAANPNYTEEILRAQEGDVSEIEFMCVAPDTLVSAETGLKVIGELCPDRGLHKPHEELRLNSRRGLFAATGVIRNGERETLEVETVHGLKVTCTADQEFLAVSSDLGIRWVAAKNLVPGTHLALGNKVSWPTQPPAWSFDPVYPKGYRKRTSIPKRLTRRLARFLGYHASEGSLSRTSYRLKFQVSDLEVAENYLALFNRLFKLNYELHVIPKETMDLATKDAYSICLYRRDVYDWMHVIGADGDSYTKEVPWVILQAPRTCVVEFLRGLFEGDGSVGKDAVTLELSSEKLIRQSQILLLQFNILSAVNPSKGGHRLVVSGVNRDRFISSIGFVSARKRGFKVNGATKKHSLTLQVPNLSRGWSTPRTKKVKLHRLHELPQSYLEKLDPATRARIGTLKGYVTSPVRSVAPGPVVETCDFVIPESKRFVANGLVVHNCDFGCIPPYSDSPWWENKPELLNLCASKKLDVSLWQGHPESLQDETGEALRWIYYRLQQVSTDRSSTRCLGFDTGEKACSFSWTVARYERMTDTIVVEDVGELAPGSGEQIHFGLMWEHVIEKLVQNFAFQHVVWDRWNSSRYVADLRTKYKVRAEQYTATTKDGKGLKSDFKNGKIMFPVPEVDVDSLPIGNNVAMARTPRAHLLLQCLTVRDQAGLPVKPQGGNDDTFRSMLLAQSMIRANIDLYSRGQRWGGSRTVGVGVGGRVAGGGSSGMIVGAGGRGIACGPRSR